jgi:hypothetical protein
MTWINPNTGKRWTDQEESAFAEIMAMSGLERLPAIRLYRRFKGDLRRAIKHARGSGNPEAQANRQAALVKARSTRRLKGVLYRENCSQQGQSAFLASQDGSGAQDARNRETTRNSQGGSRA